MSKKLVAYFSASGVTAKVAETLAEAIGADIFEIEPKVPYTEADLNWMDKTKIHRLAPEVDGVKPYIDGFEIKILGMTVYRETNE